MSDGRQELLPLFTTEHFTLQSARAATIGESGARTSLYVGTVSSALVALGFIGQLSRVGAPFKVFALVVLPTLVALGTFTFVRLSELVVEDFVYARAINRVRHLYVELAGEDARYLMLEAHDDALGVIRNMGLRRGSRWQLYFTAAAMVGAVNSVVFGVTVAVAVWAAADPGLAACAGAGAGAGVPAFAAHARYARRRTRDSGGFDAVLFPSPPA